MRPVRGVAQRRAGGAERVLSVHGGPLKQHLNTALRHIQRAHPRPSGVAAHRRKARMARTAT
eukprot:7032079-Lingulodinium_polyedra.AAC.1